MAQIKQNVLGVLKGKVGSLTTYSNNTGNVARIRTNATNVGESASRTRAQQVNRVRWANLVNFYRASKAWMPKAFESKKKSRSDYNQFMSINYVNAKCALTKQEAAAGACVVEGFLISQGSLTPVQVQKHEDHYNTNIALGSLALSAATTVAEFSAAVVEANNFIREGMQLSCISYQQIVDDLGTPRVICTAYEMRLDTKNTEEKAMDFLPEFCLASEDGMLVTSNDISLGGFAFVLSETVSGKTLVSTQSLIVNNETLIAQYSGADQQTAAIQSYGLSSTVFLDSEVAFPKGATPQPLYIEKFIGYDENVYVANDYVGAAENVIYAGSEKLAAVVMSSALPSGTSIGVKFTVYDDVIEFTGTVVAVTGNMVKFFVTEGTSSMRYNLKNITVTIDGTDYTIPFGGVQVVE